MYSNILNKINVSSKILILFLISSMLLMANSIFFLMFVTILIVTILVLIDKNVKLYVDTLKKTSFWLLFLGIIYIMIFRDILSFLIFVYKTILTLFLLTAFMQNINFISLTNGIYTNLLPLKKIVGNIKLEKLSYNVSRFIYFLVFIIDSGSNIVKAQQLKNKRKVGIKYYLFPKLFYSFNKLNVLEENLKIDFYKVKREKINLTSLVFDVIFQIIFIAALFKEVIL